MSRVLAVLIGLIILAPLTASAGSVGISWDDCVAPPPAVKFFACDTNTGSDNLIGSFEPNLAISDVVGMQATIQLLFRDGFVPSWWQTGFGGCRLGGLTVTGALTAQQTACADPWQGQAVANPVMVEPAYLGDPARLRITMFMAVPPSAAFSVAPGTDYYGYRLQIHHASTVGPGSCSGCDRPAIIVAEEILLTNINSDVERIFNAAGDQYVCWQCDCGLYSEGGVFFGTCGATPALNHTWGGIKSLYR